MLHTNVNITPLIDLKCIVNFMGEFEENCTIGGIHENNVWLLFDNETTSKILRLDDCTFKPLKTEREIAIDEMIGSISNIKVKFLSETFMQFCGELFDNGYRKP